MAVNCFGKGTRKSYFSMSAA